MRTAIIDNGEAVVKAGFAAPRFDPLDYLQRRGFSSSERSVVVPKVWASSSSPIRVPFVDIAPRDRGSSLTFPVYRMSSGTCDEIRRGSLVDHKTKAGGDEQLPDFLATPSIVGRMRHPGILVGFRTTPLPGSSREPTPIFCGLRCVRLRGIVRSTRPNSPRERGKLGLAVRRIEKSEKMSGRSGRAFATDDIQYLWRYALGEKGGEQKMGELYDDVVPTTFSDTRVMLVSKLYPWDRSFDRRRASEVLFEQLGVGAVSVAPSCSLAVYASGSVSGLNVDIGESCTTVVGVLDGELLEKEKLPIGGIDVVSAVGMNIAAEGYMMTMAYTQVSTDVLHRACFVLPDGRELDDSVIKTATTPDPELSRLVELPDGNRVLLKNAAFSSTENLFRASWDRETMDSVGPLGSSMATVLLNLRKRLGSKIFDRIRSNVVLSGGPCSLPNIHTRIRNEIIQHSKNEISHPIVPRLRDPTLLPWLGGYVAAQLSPSGMWTSREEYDEMGDLARLAFSSASASRDWQLNSVENPASAELGERIAFASGLTAAVPCLIRLGGGLSLGGFPKSFVLP